MKSFIFIKNLGWAGVALFFVVVSATGGTNVQRLDAGWEFYRGSLGSLWEIWRGEAATDNVKWTPVTLPHCFNARDCVDPDTPYYQGPGWYRTKIKIANPFPAGRTLLHFEGSGQKSKVYVGLDKVGEHIGGYDEWDVDITDAATQALANKNFAGQVPVAVLCDNSRDAEMIPSDLSDFCRYGGLYRHVSLVYVPAISLAQVHIESKLSNNGKALVKVRARLGNPASLTDAVEFTLDVRDSQNHVIQIANKKIPAWRDEREMAALEIISPRLWLPGSPSLYHCSVTLKSVHGEQTVSKDFGLRSLAWIEHGPFTLNGQRLLLRGTQYHEDHAGTAAAVPDEIVRKTFQQIKDMGANFVRLGHYQQSPLVLELCDELGLLVWEEFPWCRGGLGGERYRQQCRDMLTHMIDQHYNHPSVILWGLGNELDWPGDFATYDTNAIRNFLAELNALAHQLDPSRQTCIRRCDFCKDIVDVYSPSIWAGWYGGRYTEYRAATEKAIAENKHFFHAEWGGDSHAGRHAEEPEKFLGQVVTGEGTAEVGRAYQAKGGKARASKDGDWSESYIINLFDWHLREQETMSNLTGSAMWIFKDFPTPLRPENPVPRVNQKGVLTRDGTPKESYYVFQSYWANQPMLHIYGHTWPVRWGQAGEAREVKVFSNCREVELFVNDVSAGVKQRHSSDFPAAGLRWLVKFNEGANHLRAVGHHAGGDVSDEISLQYQTAEWTKPVKLALKQVGENQQNITVEVRALDKDAVPCLDAANLVRFGLTGDGVLLDNLGTPTGSRVVQLANGRAQISLHLTARKVVVSVSSQGFSTQFLNVTNAAGSLAAASISANVSTGRKAGRLAEKFAGPIMDVAAIDRDRILQAAGAALTLAPFTITDFPAKESSGGRNDYFSMADYFWPDPAKTNGLPFIQRDGESYPGLFTAHRMMMRNLRDAVAALGAAYQITGEDRYAVKAAQLLKVFFVDPLTRMNPKLEFAQAVLGKNPGRGIGIIDTLHIIEIPAAIAVMERSPAFTPALVADLKQWFRDYLEWMLTSKNGKEEAAAKNNHSVAFWLQVACFARFTGDEARLADCRRQFKEVFVPNQMAEDGSFPLELKRTKPYAYSIFQLDNMTTLCQVLSTSTDDLWNFELPDGRGIRKALAYLYPFIADKSKWPLKPDVMAWDGWPMRQSHLLFAGLALGEVPYLDLWKKLAPDPKDLEVRRNVAITQPILWIAEGAQKANWPH